MNGPKVRQILKSSSISQESAHEMINRFLQREGKEEIILHENLSRLLGVCQSMTKGGHSKLQSVVDGVTMISNDENSPSDDQRVENKVKKKRKKDSTVSTDKASRKRKRGKDATDD
jgi:hypothetical protein